MSFITIKNKNKNRHAISTRGFGSLYKSASLVGRRPSTAGLGHYHLLTLAQGLKEMPGALAQGTRGLQQEGLTHFPPSWEPEEKLSLP